MQVGGTGDEKTVEIKENWMRFSYKTKRGDIFAVYQCTGVIMEGGELSKLTKKLK